jgi:SAM-dependent methyltransferase
MFFRELRRLLLELTPAVTGKWLDVECGSGLWMQSIADPGIDIAGVESDAGEAARCEARGLPVVLMDPLRFLSNTAPKLFAGITALRVLERHPMEWNFRLLRECARHLLPGGTILITGSDPASGVASAREFWIDPRSFRPVPVQTVTAMLEHLGLQVLNIRGIREWKEEEKLPLDGFEPVRDLNACLFGAREYAVVARRASVA